MAEPSYTLEIEFETGSFTNVTDRLLTANVNRRVGGAFLPLGEGMAMFTLDNDDGAFSPSNGLSPYAGKLRPGRSIRMTATHSANTWFVFNGETRRFIVDPMRSSRVTLECVDPITRLRNKKIDTGMLTDTNPGSVFTEIFSQTGVQSTIVSSFTHTIPFVWYNNKSAINAVRDLLEFGHYWIYGRADGAVVVENQNWNLEPTATASYAEYYAMNYALDSESVMNDLRITSEPRKLASVVQTVAWIQEPISVPASGSTRFWLQYVDPDSPLNPAPAKNMVTPVSSADYQTSTQSGGGGTDTTNTTSVSVTFFGESALCDVFNGYGQPVYLNKFQLRGNSIQRQPRISYATDSSTSQQLYGDRSVTIENDFIGTLAYAENYGQFLLNRYSEVFPDITFTLKNEFPDVLRLDIGDTVSLVESITGIRNDAIITSVNATIDTQRGIEHTVQYGVDLRLSIGFLVLDDANYGKLDERRLGF